MEEKLRRELGRWDLTAIAINTIIGTGIFILPAKAAGLIGSYSILAILVCAFVVAAIILCFAEVSSRFSQTGGMYLYAREAFGPVAGFETGWLYWIVRIATFAANCNAFLIYLAFIYPSANQGTARWIIVFLIVFSITLINLLGIRQSAIMTNIFTIGKILPLLLFSIIGLFYFQPKNLDFSILPEYGKFSEAVLLLIYAYVGFEAAVIPAGESKSPGKNLPFALIAAVIFCAILFVFIQAVALGTLPELAMSERPLADAAGKFMGATGMYLIVFGALVSILGNLNGGFLAASRMPFAMSENGDLPKALSLTQEKFKTPYISILITSSVIFILTIQSSFFSAVTIATITRLLVYATTCLAVPIFRRRKDLPAAEFSLRSGLLFPAVSILLILWLLTNVDYTKEGLPVIIAAAAGFFIFFAYRLLAK
ncbi:MAG TPA: amino acid permease [Pyrinomonadaceae bacterium]|nr:amino acid permease [Pyrinomonadaceae bacterium]